MSYLWSTYYRLGNLCMLPLIPTITFQQGRYYLPYVGEEIDLKSLPNFQDQLPFAFDKGFFS